MQRLSAENAESKSLLLNTNVGKYELEKIKKRALFTSDTYTA